MPYKTIGYTPLISILILALWLTSCTEGPSKRASKDENMISARARNHLATENPAGLVRVGEGFERSGNYQSALNLYGQAMAADPALLSAQIAYARVLGALGSFDKAVFILSQLLEDYPENPEIVRTLIHIYSDAGEFKAASLFAGALEQGQGTSSEDRVLIGRLLYTQGLKKEGILSLQKAVDSPDSTAESLQYLAYGFALEGNYETAVALIQKIIDMPDRTLSGQEALAYIYALSGQTGAALKLIRAAKGADNIQNIRIFYQVLPRFSEEAKAQALMFNYVDPSYMATFLAPQ